MSPRSIAFLLTLSLASSANADIVLSEFFNYNTGNLNGRNGGTGFKSAWSGDSVQVASGSLSYFDSKGNELNTSGNKVRGNGNKAITIGRDIADGFAESEVWTGAILSSDSNVLNFSIEEKVFIGQGQKDKAGTNWSVGTSDSTSDSGILASGSSSYLVTRILVDSDNKVDKLWAWVNPDLDSVPLLENSFTGVDGLDVSDAGAVFSKISLSINSSGSFADEIRFGQSFEDISGNIPAVPEPGTLAFMGVLAGAGYCVRRRKSKKSADE